MTILAACYLLVRDHVGLREGWMIFATSSYKASQERHGRGTPGRPTVAVARPGCSQKPGLIGELYLETGHVAKRRLEAHLERFEQVRPDLSHDALTAV